VQQIAEVDVLPMWNLDGDFLVHPGVFRQVNGAESAAANCRQDLVLPDRLASKEHAGSIQAPRSPGSL
jgi:hypothetical protein